jgi:cytochrome c-type biogenesis protein CcmH
MNREQAPAGKTTAASVERQRAAANSRKQIAIAAVAAIALVLAGAAVWWSQNVRQQSAAESAPAPASLGDPALAEQADEIRQRLQATPADGALWQSLARTYVLMGKFAEAVPAYRSAIDNGADGAPVQSAYGEAQVMAASGEVTPAALTAFQAALAKDAAEARARYYVALADAQGGKLHEALDAWIKLESESASDAPWRKSLSARIDQTANALGLDPAKLPGRGGAGPADEPSIEDLNKAARLTPPEREKLLADKTKTLAARLLHEPGDLKGWQILGLASKLLGDHRQSMAAWQQAARLGPDDSQNWTHYAEAILAVHGGEQKLPPEFAEATRRLRALEPKGLEGLFFAGLVEQDAGNIAGAQTLWEELLLELPEDSPQRAEIQRRLDALAGGG